MPELSGSTYSELDASNSQPAPNGMPEGMAPSGVNDAWRAGMGALARFWGRIQCRYASTGAANAYVLTPAAALAAYATGERYSFRANFTNTGAATLAISGLVAASIKKMSNAGKAALSAGDIQNGQPVTVEYDGTDFVMTTPVANTFNGTTPLAMAGAAINEAFATIASAATVNIGAAPANYLQVTGTATITAFDAAQAGTERTLAFAGALTLSNNASIILPGGASITTAAGDTAIFRSEGSGVWRCVDYQPASGKVLPAALASAATAFTGTDATQALTASSLGSNVSLANNGYAKLPGGLIIQWGSISVPINSVATGTFPIAFPNTCFQIIGSYETSAAPGNAAGIVPISASQYTAQNQSTSSAYTISWIAIGH